jgi:integrase
MPRPRGATPKPHKAADGTVSWKVRYRTASGRGTSETFYGEQAEAAAAEFAGLLRTLGPTRAIAYLDEQTAGGDRHGPALTVDDLFNRWFEWKSAKKRDGTYQRVRSKRTLDDYASQYRRKIEPRFGRTPANLVASSDVQRWTDDLGGEIEPKTVLDYHGLLRALYLWGLHPTRALVIHDPCADTDLPKRKKKAPKGLHPAEWMILHAAALQVDRDAADLLLFKASTGWRWSECVAIPVAAIDHWVDDMDRSWTYVTMGRVLRRTGSTFELVDDAKSDAGSRRIRLVGPAEQMVLDRIAGKPADQLVFTTKTGRRWVYSNFHDRIWTRPKPGGKTRDMAPKKPRILEVAKTLGLERPDVTPHWLRHTHAGMLILSGESLPAIQKRLGHASIQTTVDVYGRMIEDASDAGLDKVAAMLGGTPPAAITSRHHHDDAGRVD